MKRCGEVVDDTDPLVARLGVARFFYLVLGAGTTAACVAYVLLVTVPEPVWSACRWTLAVAALSFVASSALYFIYTVGRWAWTRRS